MGRKEDDGVVKGVMYGSRSARHMTMVPPWDLMESRARSGVSFSSLFSSMEYCPWKCGVRRERSQWKIWGSLRKTRSGLYWSQKCLRLTWFLLIPSMFQDIHFRFKSSLHEALELCSKLSEIRSLNQSSLPGVYLDRRSVSAGSFSDWIFPFLSVSCVGYAHQVFAG